LVEEEEDVDDEDDCPCAGTANPRRSAQPKTKHGKKRRKKNLIVQFYPDVAVKASPFTAGI
jgi:hypothetical protein